MSMKDEGRVLVCDRCGREEEAWVPVSRAVKSDGFWRIDESDVCHGCLSIDEEWDRTSP